MFGTRTSGTKCRELDAWNETSGMRHLERDVRNETSGTRWNEISGARCLERKACKESRIRGGVCNAMCWNEISGTRCEKVGKEFVGSESIVRNKAWWFLPVLNLVHVAAVILACSRPAPSPRLLSLGFFCFQLLHRLGNHWRLLDPSKRSGGGFCGQQKSSQKSGVHFSRRRQANIGQCVMLCHRGMCDLGEIEQFNSAHIR